MMKVDAKDLRAALGAVLPFTADKSRDVPLQQVHLERHDGRYRLVAANDHVVVYVDVAAADCEPAPSILIAPHNCKVIRQELRGHKGHYTFDCTAYRVEVDDTYPKYEKVVPEKSSEGSPAFLDPKYVEKVARAARQLGIVKLHITSGAELMTPVRFDGHDGANCTFVAAVAKMQGGD